MGKKDSLKEIDIKNCTFYYFDDIMKTTGIYSGNISLEEKIYKNILIYDISYETFKGSKPVRIWFDKKDGFIKIYDGIRYLVLLGHSWYDKICDSINYLISKESGIKDCNNHNLLRIRIDSYNSLPIEKMLTFHNVIILIKSVVNKNENYYDYNIFLEKGSYKDKFNT